jgi:phosphatidylinositol alpha-1,6-mannosyltransferase
MAVREVPRTLVLSERFLPLEGGAITWLANTYARYRNGDVSFLVGEHPGADETDRLTGYRVERMRMDFGVWDPFHPKALRSYIRMMWRLYRVCRRHGVEQIHCTKVMPEGLAASCVAGWLRIPFLIYAHGEEITICNSSRKLARLAPRIYNRAAAIIANSRNTAGLLKGIGVLPGKIHIISPGVDLDTFRHKDHDGKVIRDRHGLGAAPVLLTVGRLQRRKGQDMVIRALPGIRRRIPGTAYVIVGTGEEEGYLHEVAGEVGVPDHVVFAGPVPAGELPAYYAACDVFVMPSRQIGPDIEGFGIVYLEAGAAGKPVVGGKSGGTEDAIVDGVTGYRVDGESLDAIESAVVRLLANPQEARTMGEKGRSRAEAEFGWDAIAQRTKALSVALR